MKFEISYLDKKDGNFPRRLANIPRPPAGLYCLGNISLLSAEKAVAVVGTRKATRVGCQIAYRLAYDLAKRGIVIVSGLAIGIDSAAHQGCLDAGGRTIAVLAGGLDNIYPSSNRRLAQKIIETGGGIVSEYAGGTSVLPHQFLARNRIVSALSDAVAVVEAPAKSGALSTANHAADQGKEVFVVPGSVFSSNYEGSHKLIRDGARLATNWRDICEDLGWVDLEDKFNHNYSDLNESEKQVLDSIKTSAGISADDLINQVGDRAAVIAALSSLLLDDLIIEIDGAYFLNNG